MARRHRSLKRKRSSRNPKAKIIIVSEGRLTEPDYFYALARACGALVSFDVILERGAGVPLSVVEKAIETFRRSQRLTSFGRNDTIWAVFDRDEHPHFETAIERAKAAGVKPIISIPCFELWLVLHFIEWDRPIDRHAIQRRLRDLMPSYDPNGSKRADYAQLAESVSTAINRARVMERRRTEERTPLGNPLTTVFQLVEHIQQSKRS
jgi:hypothetical protein